MTAAPRGITAGNSDVLDAYAFTVAGLGDVNGDGYDDVAVSGSSGAGGATVFLGASARIQTSESMPVVGKANAYFGRTIRRLGRRFKVWSFRYRLRFSGGHPRRFRK